MLLLFQNRLNVQEKSTKQGLFLAIHLAVTREKLKNFNSPVDDYRKAFKNNFFATPCIPSDLLGLYAGYQNIRAYAGGRKKVCELALSTRL